MPLAGHIAVETSTQRDLRQLRLILPIWSGEQIELSEGMPTDANPKHSFVAACMIIVVWSGLQMIITVYKV